MASSGEEGDFKYHCIVFHTDDEYPQAEKLCQDITQYGEKTGRHLNATTFDSFSNPGKQDLENLHDAVAQSRVILCSEEYSAHSHMSHFFANAALHDKIQGRFIMLKIDKSTAETNHPTLETLSGIRLTSDWDFHANDLEKLVQNLSGKKPERQTPQARSLPDLNTGAGESDLPTRVITDAEPVSMSGPGSQVPTSPQGNCPGEEGKETVKRSGSTKPWGKNRPKKCTMSGDKDKKYMLDAIVFHSKDEERFAESFLQILRPLGIQAETFENVAHPAKQDLSNLNDALKFARYVFCSVRFYEENEHGRFFANTALHNKSQESEFILLHTGSTSDTVAHMNSLRGVRLSEEWQFLSKQQEDNLVKLLREKCTQDRKNTPGELGPGGSLATDKQQEIRIENSGGAGLQGSQETPQPREDAADDPCTDEIVDGLSQAHQHGDSEKASPTPAHLAIDNVSVTSSFFNSVRSSSGMRSHDVPGDDTEGCPEPSYSELFQSDPFSPHISESDNPRLLEIGADNNSQYRGSPGEGASATAEKSLVQSSDHQNTERKRVGDISTSRDSQQAGSRSPTAVDSSNNLPDNGLEKDDKSIISKSTSGDSSSAYHDYTSCQTYCQRESHSTQSLLSNTSPPTAVAGSSSAGNPSACFGDGQSAATLYAKPAQTQSSIPSSEPTINSNQELMEHLQIRDSLQSSGYVSNSSAGRSDVN